MSKLKKLSVIHPFLFALFAVLFIFAHNICEVYASDIILPIVAVITGTSVLFFSLRLITKSYVKSGIITSWFLVLFFSYEPTRQSILSLELEGFINRVWFSGSVWALFFIAVAFLVIKSRSNFQTFTKFLNITAVTLVAISLINISIYEIKAINLGQGKTNEQSSLSNSENLPDIYYIILDEYARADTLKELYNYDNSEFIDYLTKKGFYIASKSRSNYSLTVLSLASSLNMEYRAPTFKNNKVSQFLKSKGYRYIFIPTAYFYKDMDKYAEVYTSKSKDLLLGMTMSGFTAYLVRSTALAPFAVHFWEPNYELNLRGQVLYAFDKLANMPDEKGPKFVFAHVNCPHPPFVFDRNGESAEPIGEECTLEDERQRYLEQLLFVNKKVKTLVDEILSKSDVAPIIILQSDSGPQSTGQFDNPNAELTEVQLNERMNILNAYYLPGKDNSLLYESITPVNSFRIIFNLYFDTDYELLEDKSYFSQYESPNKFISVPPESNSDYGKGD